ncbi:MAG TPA: DEAD/DEAH box helicase [Burkholderiales bacterium]|nr:DEAD/DEAH box helicase [Burkholderiales bacterium]
MSQAFESLGLIAELVRAVSEEGYTQPTPVQSESIPVILAGRDVLAGAQTGTGKTAGFTLPMLQLLSARAPQSGRRPVRALVLTPTRELAAQVEESVRIYGRHLALRSTMIFGGVGMQPQVDALRRGVDIVVATPGRLLDHLGQKTIDLSRIEILVLDEADRMLDMGFIHDIRKVLAALPRKRQNLLFSATFSDEIRALAAGLLDHPAQVQVAPRNAESALVAQRIHPVESGRKRALLAHLVSSGDWRQVLVFTRTKHGANRLAEQLCKDGIEAAAIHGNKSQGARTRALASFKSGELRVLVATDLAARGLDIEQLPHVVNFELPNVPEQYVHRIGRTGRAGVSGEAISLVAADEMAFLADIEKLMRRSLPREVVPGFEPNASAARAETSRPAQAPRRNQPQHARRNGGGERRRARGGDNRRQAVHPKATEPARDRQPQSNANAQFPSSGALDRKYAKPNRPRRGGGRSVPALLGGTPRR